MISSPPEQGQLDSVYQRQWVVKTCHQFLHNYSELYPKSEKEFLLADLRCLVSISAVGSGGGKRPG